jgi:amidase
MAPPTIRGTAESITTALNSLVDRLEKLEVRVVRENPRLPDLAQTGQIYRELLAAFFIADLPPETLERAATAVKDLPADDQSLAAAQLRGLTISHCRLDPQKPHPERAAGALAGAVRGR